MLFLHGKVDLFLVLVAFSSFSVYVDKQRDTQQQESSTEIKDKRVLI